MKKAIKWLALAMCAFTCIGVASACKEETAKNNGQTLELQKDAELKLNKTHAVLAPGATLNLEATLFNVEKDEATPFVWQSYNTDIATVENGVVTAGAFGTTYISVNYGTLNASCKITVESSSTSIDELELKLSQATVKLNAVYADNKTATLTATAYKNGEAVETACTWESDNTEYVTVKDGVLTALKNGGVANVTVRARVGDTELSSVCKVYAQDEVLLTLTAPQTVLEPSEEYIVPVTVTVNGASVEEKPVWRTLDASVATVKGGKIKAVNGGKTRIEATFGNVTESIEVTVRSYVYVATAEQFLAIGKGDETYTYVLADNIDLGAYLSENIWLNEPYLIENFRGTLDGQGYAVTGLTRYCNEEERSLSGVFESVAKSATLKNIGFGIAIQTQKTGSTFAKQMSGKIENCYFDIELNGKAGAGASYALFSSAVGSVKNSVLNIKSAQAVTAFTLYGFVKCENCLVIADDIVCGGTVNGVGSAYNPYFTDCYLYASESALLTGEGYELVGEGKGNASAQTQYADFDEAIWSFNSTVALKNATSTTAIVAPKAQSAGDKAFDITGSYEIADQTATGLVFDCYILNEKGKTVHTFKEDGNTFNPTATGKYTVVTTLTNADGVTGYNVARIRVTNAKELVLTTKSFVLKLGETGTVAIEGKKATDCNYYSDNASIATVNENGVIEGKTKGSAQILVVDKTTGASKSLTVDVINVETVTKISNVEEFLALEGKQEGYYVLTSDITLTWSQDKDSDKVYKLETKNDEGVVTRTELYARIIDGFGGTLDGNGHKITLKYNATETKYIPCGIFYCLETTAMIKNLHYEFEGEYARTNMSVFAGLFAYNCQGKVQDCYMEAHVVQTGGSVNNDQEAFIAIATNPSGNPTAGFYNNVFNLTIINEYGVVADKGYAIRYGSRGPAVEHCVFIRNGATKVFYGTNANGGSACELRYTYFYRTVYDFVNAKNGATVNQSRQASNIPDNAPVYTTWSQRWSISESGVYLLNRKVADVEYESYGEAPVMEVTHAGRMLTWEDKGAFEISLNGEYVGRSSNGSFNIYDAIAERYVDVTGSYDVIVEDVATGVTGIAIVKIIGITQDNFVSIVQTEQNKVENAHYVMVENITLGKAHFDQGQKLDSSLVVVKDLYVPIDGNGYTLSVEGDLYSNIYNAVFGSVRSEISNVIFNYEAKRTKASNDRDALFAMYIENAGAVRNCYLRANVTYAKLDGTVCSSGELGTWVAENNFGAHMFTQTSGSTSNYAMENVLIDVNVTNEGSVPIGALRMSANNRKSSNVVVLGGDNTTKSFITMKTSNTNLQAIQIKACYYYPNFTDFMSGANGKTTGQAITTYGKTTWTDTTEIAYGSWDSVWTIAEGRVELCGKAVYPIARKISASLDGNILTVLDNDETEQTYDVYIGTEKAGTFTGASCNVIDMLEKAGKLKAGENALTLTLKTATGRAVETTLADALKVFGIDQTNFVTTVRTAQADVKTDYYYIMCSDVTLGYADYSTEQKLDNYYSTVTANMYIPLDGNGHTLTVSGHIKTEAGRYDTNYSAVFGNLYSEIKNLVFNDTTTRGLIATDGVRALFVMYIQNAGSIKNCYLNANVTFVNATGTVLTADEMAGKNINMVVQIAGSSATPALQSVIVNINVTNAGTYKMGVVGRGANGRPLNNVVLLGDNTTKQVFTAISTNTVHQAIQMKECYCYATLSDFVNARNGLTTGATQVLYGNATWTATSNEAYANWDSVWTISQTGIQLCGSTVYTA